MTSLTWVNLIVLSLTSQWLTMVDSRLIQHQNNLLDERYAPDAEIESFIKSHRLRYPVQSEYKALLKGQLPLPYYYNYEEDFPSNLDSLFKDPARYEHDDAPHPEPQHQSKDPSREDQPSRILDGQSSTKQIATSKAEEAQRIKPQQVPHGSVQHESSKVKVESRSSAGHVGANEVVALAPGLPEALRQREAKANQESSIADVYLLAVIAGCAVAAVSGLALTGVCWYRLHKRVKAASDVEYPAYGVTGPAKEKNGPPGDRKLAQSAQMYHYQHQKQQMIASERLGPDNGGNGGSEGESDEECEEGDYTVFECPGLATAGEMEVRNPLFNDQTPVATPADNK